MFGAPTQDIATPCCADQTISALPGIPTPARSGGSHDEESNRLASLSPEGVEMCDTRAIRTCASSSSQVQSTAVINSEPVSRKKNL